MPGMRGSGSKYIKDPAKVQEKTVTGIYLRLCFGKERVNIWNTDASFWIISDWSTAKEKIYRTPEEAEAALEGENNG